MMARKQRSEHASRKQQVEEAWSEDYYLAWGEHADFSIAYQRSYSWRDRWQRLRRYDLKGAITGRYWTGVVGTWDDNDD